MQVGEGEYEKFKEYPAPAMIIVYSRSITTIQEVSSELDSHACIWTMGLMGGLYQKGVRRERSVVMCVEQVIPDTMMDELEGTS